MSLRVTVVDEQTGETQTGTVPDNDYMLLVTGTCHLAHTQASDDGTHVLTVKGRRGL